MKQDIFEVLKGKTFRDNREMCEELDSLGYDVIDYTDDYVFVMDIDDRESEFPMECALKLSRTENKITIL